jgi:hypothetical protein
MMDTKRRNETIVLAVLVIGFALVFWYNRSHTPELAGVFASSRSFKPLNVEDPTLRMDLLEKIHKQEYAGTHRNIFSAEPPPPPAPPASERPVVGPVPPAAPPPLEVPATFFGYAMNPQTGKRQAFFTNGDDVFVVEEGGMLLNRFKVVKIGNNTVDLEEASSGRHVTLTMELPPQQ